MRRCAAMCGRPAPRRAARRKQRCRLRFETGAAGVHSRLARSPLLRCRRCMTVLIATSVLRGSPRADGPGAGQPTASEQRVLRPGCPVPERAAHRRAARLYRALHPAGGDAAPGNAQRAALSGRRAVQRYGENLVRFVPAAGEHKAFRIPVYNPALLNHTGGETGEGAEDGAPQMSVERTPAPPEPSHSSWRFAYAATREISRLRVARGATIGP